MWYAFWSVVHDLWFFTIGRAAVTQPTMVVASKQLPSPFQPLQLGNVVPPDLPTMPVEATPLVQADTAIPTPASVPAKATASVVVAKPESPASAPVASTLTKLTEADEETALATRLGEPTIMYVSALEGAVCLREPREVFDATITTLPFGTAVTVSGFSGRYAHVLKGNGVGWILKDDITPHRQEVWPELKTWGMYGADNPVTVKIRALLQDEFGAGALALPLQAGEYILLRLMHDKRKIVWSDNRPRLPGSWHELLKGTVGIHSTITPKTDSIMEWQTDSDGGRLAYVESVGLDGVITTSCVGLVVAGQYTKQVWQQGDWRELRPTFIEVS